MPTFGDVGQAILPTATPALLEWLLADEDPHVRALAVWGYAMKRQPDPLLQLVCDRTALVLCEGGCMPLFWSETLGRIAQQSLIDTVHFRPLEERLSPVLDDHDAALLYLQIRAVDGCQMEGFFSGQMGHVPPYAGSWSSLRAALPKWRPWMLAKSIGRSLPHPAPILVDALDDPTASPDLLLAAASALTRTTEAAASDAIARHAAALDRASPGAARRFLDTIELRRRLERRLQPIEDADQNDDLEPYTDRVIEMLRIDHPMVIESYAHHGYFDETYLYGHYKQRFPRAGPAWTAYLHALLGRLRDHEACWNTYRNVAFELQHDFDTHPEAAQYRLGQRFEEFYRALQAQVRRLDADERCHGGS